MSVQITDTHPLIWYTLNKPASLSPKALAAFQAAETGAAFIYVPAVVFWEIALLESKGKIKLFGGFSRWAEKLLSNSGFGLAPLEPAVIDLAVGYNFNNDLFDQVIVATAAELSVPLITKDKAITDSNLVEIYW